MLQFPVIEFPLIKNNNDIFPDNTFLTENHRYLQNFFVQTTLIILKTMKMFRVIDLKAVPEQFFFE